MILRCVHRELIQRAILFSKVRAAVVQFFAAARKNYLLAANFTALRALREIHSDRAIAA
jgi:hypothetical protein